MDEHHVPDPPPDDIGDRPAGPAGMGRRVAILVGVAVVVGGAVFAAMAMDGEGKGTPEIAVRRLLEAVAEEDLLGVMEALPPSERDVLQGPAKELVAELTRLDVLQGDFDLSKIAGLEIDVADAVYSEERLAEGVALVDVSGGTITMRLDPDALPLGDLARDAFPDIEDAGVETATLELGEGDELQIAAIQEDGAWYASAAYSVAEAARRGAGAPLPPAFGVQPTGGAASPEEAVRNLFDAATELDVEKMIGLLPPDEARVLHDYAPLFVPDLQEGAAAIREAFDLQFTTLDLATEADGDEAQVTVENLGFELQTDPDSLFGDFDDEGSMATYAYANGCLTVTGAGPSWFDSTPESEEAPLSSATPSRQYCGAQKFGALPGLDALLFFYVGELPHVNIDHPDAGFVTVERGGLWYVSPTRTMLDSLVAYLRVLDRDKLQQLTPDFGYYDEPPSDYYEGDGYQPYPDDDFLGPDGSIEVPPGVTLPDDYPYGYQPYDTVPEGDLIPLPSTTVVPREPAGGDPVPSGPPPG